MATKFLFQSYQNSFSASYFPISQETPNQSSSLIHDGIIIEISECSENENWQNYRNQDIVRQLFQITVMARRP